MRLLNRDILSPRRWRSGAALEALEPRQLMAFGQVDSSFGIAGRVVTNPDVNVTLSLQDLEVTPDGTITGGGGGGLVRWDGAGQLDTSFGLNG